MEVGRVPEGRTEREYAHTVIVRSNDPERPVVRLTVRATAVRSGTGRSRRRRARREVSAPGDKGMEG